MNLQYFIATVAVFSALNNCVKCDTISENVANNTSVNLSPASLDLTKFPGELCSRNCDRTRPRICYFKWVMEHYHSMGPACKQCARGKIEDCFNLGCISADGVERGVMSINREIPGPAIHVCRNDKVVVDITNAMAGTAGTIHWHGFHQRATPHMDGVPFITQCPIEFSTTFRYDFTATEAGTQFYHSHSGHHKVNGQYGAFIVRQPEANDPNSELYDFDMPEHTIVASDWMHSSAEMFMPGLPTRPSGILPTNLLINGRGLFENRETNLTNSPLEVFRVKKGGRYRFRFINSGSHICPFQFQIEKHRLNIIASDSYSLKPKMVDTIISTSGERYDFILNADQQEGDYYMRLRATGPCLANRQVEQFAVLSYRPMTVKNIELARPPKPRPSFGEIYDSGVYINHPNTTCFDTKEPDFCIADFSAYTTDTSIIDATPDHIFYLAFFNYPIDPAIAFAANTYEHFMNIRNNIIMVGAVNNISFTFPPFSALTQPELITDDTFCDADHRPAKCDNRQICPCIHRIKIELNSIVELVIVDESREINPLNHPFHLHGYPLYVVGMGQNLQEPMTVERARRLALTRSLARSPNKSPPLKDTLSVPSKGYTIVRFRADNPGFWLMHCHFEWHMAVGMGLVLQVGEPNDMVKAPPSFPKCGNYLPDVNLTN